MGEGGIRVCLVQLRQLRRRQRARSRCTAAAREAAASRLDAAVLAAVPDGGALSPVQQSIAATTLACIQRLCRLGLVPLPVAGSVRVLRIHFVGVDHEEGRSPSAVLRTLLPCLAPLSCVWNVLQVVCCGPAMSRIDTGRRPLVTPPQRSQQMRVSLRVVGGMYHDFVGASASPTPTLSFAAPPTTVPHPDVAFMYNPGFWGYDSWVPTLVWLRDHTRCPCVCTAYNAFEAEDDEDVLDETVGGFSWPWRPESNPHVSSAAERPQPPAYRTLKANATVACFRACTSV